MIQLPAALVPLAEYQQFILWTVTDGKKLPLDYRTMSTGNAHDPNIWLSSDEALSYAQAMGDGYGVGFVFTEADPFYFVDIDKCLNPDNTWSQLAMDVMACLPGACIEVSQSGRGLHIFGKGLCPDHACKNVPLGLELYTESRFVALTGLNCVGSADVDSSAHLSYLVNTYFPPKGNREGVEWTDGPAEGWSGLESDEELIAKACESTGASAIFGGGSNFEALWMADIDILSESYPDGEGDRAYDGSSADAALAQHLAFWTGNDCERMMRLMKQSALVRDKWEREDYLIRTIMNAVSLQTTFYSAGAAADNSIADKYGAPTLRSKSDAQRNFAENIRAEKLAQATESEREVLCASKGKAAQAKLWLDNKDATPTELVSMVTPIAAPQQVMQTTKPEKVSGMQYQTADLQAEHFANCVYIQDIHRILAPSGALLKSEQFNATYGGYIFQLDEMGDKTTRKAWEAFTESQCMRFPKVESMCFRPTMEPGVIVHEGGRKLVNAYVPILTPRVPGDASPFLNHLQKILPNKGDREQLMSYLAACVQHKGIKFQWAPLIQGTEGNGKTLFTRCVAYAIGKRYTFMPKAAEIASKFNGWLLNRIFIGVEDIKVSKEREEMIETIKPMITGGDGIEIQMKGADQITSDICANFIFNSNHRDAIKKTQNDRRFAVFYTAQQEASDIIRDGMGGDYFPKLYKWLNDGGYAIVNELLHTYPIPEHLNPAGACHRAPITSTTHEAISASMGGVEQEVLEAVEEARVGFIGGWISSVALERLLKERKMERMVPHNKRRALLQSLGYDWHPHLTNGRANNPVAIDDGKKPRIFVKINSPLSSIQPCAEVVRAYEATQIGATA